MKINEMIQSRVAAREMEDKRLMEAWSPILSAATEYLKKHDNRELSEHEKRQIARVCENALLNAASSSSKRLFETTDSSAISFLGIQLPVVAALLPSLLLNKLAMVQALDWLNRSRLKLLNSVDILIKRTIPSCFGESYAIC